MRLEGVELGVDDLEAARAAYTLLLGLSPIPRPGGALRFQLGRGAVELVPGSPGRHALCFVVEVTDAPEPLPSFHGVDVRLGAGVPVPPSPPGAPSAIDHVVVRSPDPDRAIALWRDRLGLRLALDRVFPERGVRLVFFRSGGITLEIAGVHPPPAAPAGPDRVYGVSYRVANLAAHRERLLAAAVDVSPIRPGMRPGTSVATVRSGTAGVPTLLLEVVSA